MKKPPKTDNMQPNVTGYYSAYQCKPLVCNPKFYCSLAVTWCKNKKLIFGQRTLHAFYSLHQRDLMEEINCIYEKIN